MSTRAERRRALWRAGFAVGTESGRAAVLGQVLARRQLRDISKGIALLAALAMPDEGSGASVAEGLLAIAEREMPCTCLPAYAERGLIDPYCRHDDRDDLIAAVVEYVNRANDAAMHRAYPSAESRRWGLSGDA